MFRFFRKHSWILLVVIALTVISFIYFMFVTPGNRGGRNSGGGGTEDYGTVYGHKITAQEYQESYNDFQFYYLLSTGNWPEKSADLTDLQINQRVYIDILFAVKAKSVGISIADSDVVTAAAGILSSPGFNRAIGNRSGKPVPMDQFISQLVAPHGLGVDDFEHFIRSQMTREQLQLAMGLPGAFVTPQEASALYDHDYREASTEAVFFSASNYLNQVTASPAAVGQFFTNYMAYYREPDRVQVNYVWLNITNYVEQSKAEWAKTNLEEMVDNYYLKADPSEFAGLKTPEAAKAKIRDALIKQRAYNDAATVARDFVNTLFAMSPVAFDNFGVVAKQKSLAVRLSPPISQQNGEAIFPNVPDLTKAAFALTPDSPFSDTIAGGDGIYMIGLAAQLPSAMPSFDQIQPQVTRDYKLQQAIVMAREAGTNFNVSAVVQIAVGKTLAKAAALSGLNPVLPAPFSPSSTEVPEIGDNVELDTFKQVAFGVPPGHLSPLIPTRDGAFLLYVKSVTPPDAATKTAEMTQFISQIRHSRENEAFTLWADSEASREFRDIAALQRPASGASQP